MRLSTLAAFVAGAGIAQVAAVPIRVIIISKNPDANFAGPVPSHSIPLPPNVAMMRVGQARPAHHGCGGGRMGRFRQKGIEISNAFRQALGMPLIETAPHHPHHKFPGPLPNGGNMRGSETSVGMLQVLPHPLLGSPGGPDVPEPHRHHHPHHHVQGMSGHGASFSTRLVHSLMNLGRWEGRAVAFVLGCGIGVLLRMFWVLAVILYRSIRGPSEDEHEYSHITIIEEYEDDDAAPIRSAPPTYTYPVDEKITIESDAPKAPAADESK